MFIAPLSFLFCLMGLFLCSSFSVIFLTCHEVAEKSACIIEREKQSWEWGEWGLVGDIKRGFCAWESVGFDKTTSLSLSLSPHSAPEMAIFPRRILPEKLLFLPLCPLVMDFWSSFLPWQDAQYIKTAHTLVGWRHTTSFSLYPTLQWVGLPSLCS